jgi:hypothetical protein
MSLALPAVNGLITVTVRVGQDCAWAMDALAARTPHARAMRKARREIIVPPPVLAPRARIRAEYRFLLLNGLSITQDAAFPQRRQVHLRATSAR